MDQFLVSIEMGRRIRRNGLPGSLHTLRHDFGAHLASAGVSLHIIAKLMGHASTRTTEIYAHLMPEAIDSAIKHLPEITSAFTSGHSSSGSHNLSLVPSVHRRETPVLS